MISLLPPVLGIQVRALCPVSQGVPYCSALSVKQLCPVPSAHLQAPALPAGEWGKSNNIPVKISVQNNNKEINKLIPLPLSLCQYVQDFRRRRGQHGAKTGFDARL